MTEKEMKALLKKTLKPKRYTHTMNVIDSAEMLADLYGCDRQKAHLAALLHDCAKNFTPEKLLSIADEAGLEIDEITALEPQLLHGPVGAVVARDDFGVSDQDVLNAIQYHTTGCPDMTKLEKIIYLADFIEADRAYKGVEKLRECARQDLDDAMILAFSNTIRYIASISGLIHPRTIIARNDLILKRMKREQKGETN